ncbi:MULTISPECIES: hypothetical protein [Klebsiella]|uniref:Uncharacterized protein n=1 Tax=Klebsiella michiganensis TaxID=1134687 RepID=A0AAJ1NSJ0_9ENTR|nr:MULTISPECIES: hypothetical protein [Klebsiella]MDH0963122.1 hypothetical protein [Klebsiella michiganensis]HBM3087542.1 hypothetical protein [Klebsiella michiganensis]
MIKISAISSHTLDMDITTDGTATTYQFSVNTFQDGGIALLAVSFTTSGVANCSYLLSFHKHNNIGATLSTLSKYEYGGISISFSATYTTITLTLSSAVVGNLKISPVLLNADQ